MNRLISRHLCLCLILFLAGTSICGCPTGRDEGETETEKEAESGPEDEGGDEGEPGEESEAEAPTDEGECVPAAKLNSLTIHNDTGHTLDYISVVREIGEKVGINLLQSKLRDGAAFTISNLPDGKYEIFVGTYGPNSGHESCETVVQTLWGGNHYDYYVRILD